MKHIMDWRKAGYLTEQQVLTAHKFQRNPNRFHLSPTLFRVLREVIILERGVAEIEKERGWAARSLKVVVSLLLFSLEETEGQWWAVPGSAEAAMADEEMQEKIAFLVPKDGDRLAEIMVDFQLAPGEAKVFSILESSRDRVVPYETALRRLMEAGSSFEDPNILKTYVSKLRGKLRPHGYVIENVWGVGYRLRFVPQQAVDLAARNAEWLAVHEGGVSLRQIAKDHEVRPSTVMRAVERARLDRQQAGHHQKQAGSPLPSNAAGG